MSKDIVEAMKKGGLEVRRLEWRRRPDGSFAAETVWFKEWRIFREGRNWIGMKGAYRAYSWNSLESLIEQMDRSYADRLIRGLVAVSDPALATPPEPRQEKEEKA